MRSGQHMQDQGSNSARGTALTRGARPLSDEADMLECMSMAYGPHMAAAIWEYDNDEPAGASPQTREARS